ncbi:hypothetical protein PIB30_012608 [Stylosanthes scabra]|uniref:F-box domain-containing protein n=1 Tax=Stylosanthes scabra TaxID=79078 RepID=A0ABU6X5U4_9FABA|nr:hypothetical protein [Stylosanthes scabra]
MSSHEGWMDLPVEVLELILQRVSRMDNLMNCRATCHSWRKVAETVFFSSHLPLMLSLKSYGTGYTGILSAPWSNDDFSVLSEKWPINRYDIIRAGFTRFKIQASKAVVVFDKSDELLPTSSSCIQFCATGFDEFVVVLLCVFRVDMEQVKQKLAFFKFKQGSWTESESILEINEIFYDIAVDDHDKLYGITFEHNTSVVFVLSLKDHHHERLVMLDSIKDINFYEFLWGDSSDRRRHQLAMDTSTGELLLVHLERVKVLNGPVYTKGFRVFKLERSNLKWCEVFDIGNRFLLWDYTRVSFVSAKGLTLPEKFRGGNCIFFCHEDGDFDWGVFFLADRTISHFPINASSFCMSLQDMWFIPAP